MVLLACSFPCNKTRARWAEFLDSARSDCILLRTQLTFFVVWRQNLLEWHLKKKISLIFSWKQLLKVMWCITEPGSKSLLIHKSFVSIFCFVFRKQKWLNEILTKERGQIFAVISGFNEYVWDVGIIFSNYYFVFLGKKKKKCVWRKNIDGIKQFVKILMTPPPF